MSYSKVIRISRSCYAADGPNQWPHIRRTIRQAATLVEKVEGRQLSAIEVAAVSLHDCAKNDPHYSGDHGKTSAEKARQLLVGILSDEEVSMVCEAIADHTSDQPTCASALADLVRSADAAVPNNAWYARKCYHKMHTASGKLTHEEALKNALSRVKSGCGVLQGKHRPALWATGFAQEIAEAERLAKEISSADELWALMVEYGAQHQGESAYV